MSNNYTTNAINIKSYNLNEADKIVVMYSKDHGIIRCVAKGIKKPQSKLGGRMDLLISNRLILSKGKNLDTVCQADVLDSFKKTRKDISKLTYSMYCTELITLFGLENDNNSSEIYDLFIETLKGIDDSASKNEMIMAILRFQLELMSIAGYEPELDTCVRCDNDNEDDITGFCIQSGGVVCSKCSDFAGHKIDFNKSLRQVLKQAKFNDNKDKMDELKLNLCFNLLKDYISCRTHKKIKSADILESICI